MGRETKWSSIGGGAGGGGDVSGPDSSTDGALPEFSGTSGSLLRESSARVESDDLTLAGDQVKFNRGGTDVSADGSGLEVLGDGDATLSELLFDPLLASRWKAGPSGSLSAVLTAAASQTVQNKSLDNSNAADFKDTSLRIEDPSDATKKIRFDAGAVTAGATRVISAIDEDLTLVGLNNSQTVTGKLIQDSILDGGTAGSARKIILPKAAKTALDALTQEEGLLTYATDEKRGYISDGTSQIKVGTVDGPASATDNQLARFDGTTGKMIQSSPISSNDSGDVDGVNDLNMAGDLTVGGNTVMTGNLEVQGTQSFLNVDDLQVEDQTIQVNYGGTDVSAEGAGIEAVGTSNTPLARLQYDSSLVSKWKAGAAGSEKEILTAGDAQDVSSKTLDNTNEAGLKDDAFTLEDPADATKKVRFAAGNVTAGQTRVMSVPDADAELLGADTSQTVSNKLIQQSDFDGGTASDTSRITLPADTYANLLLLTRKAGTLLYATDHKIVYRDDGSQLLAEGSGGGDGGLNLLVNPYDGWVASGVGVAVGVTTTAADLPLPGVEASGIKIDFVSGSDYARRRFATVDGVLSTVLGISFWQKTLNSYAAGDAKLELWLNDDNTGAYGGSFSEVSLLSDASSGDTLIPAATGKLPLGTPYNFTSDGTLKYYELRIIRVSGTGSLVLQRPKVGTPAMQTAPNVGKTQAVIVTGSWVSNATYTAFETPMGEWAEYYVKVACTGAPTATGLNITLPSGRTINTALMQSILAEAGNVIPFSTVGVNDTGSTGYSGCAYYINDTTIAAAINDVNASNARIFFVSNTNPITFGNGDFVIITFKVPIKEWENSAVLSTLQQNTQSPIKAGIIMPFAGSEIPTGWLECDGSTKSQSLYHQLYAAIGSTWATCAKQDGTGGSYSSPSAGTFRVPDLRGVFLRGAGTSSDSSGANDVTVTLAAFQDDAFKSHKHTYTYAQGSGGSNYFITRNNPNTSIEADIDTSAQGSTGGTETRPRNVGVKFIIKAWDESFNLAGFGVASGGNVGMINYYQEDDTPYAFKGNLGGSASATTPVKVTRIGRVVTIDIESLTTIVPTTSSIALISTTNLPTWARPSHTKSGFTIAYNNGAWISSSVGQVLVNSSGQIQFYKDLANTAYANSAQAGFYNTQISYTV